MTQLSFQNLIKVKLCLYNVNCQTRQTMKIKITILAQFIIFVGMHLCFLSHQTSPKLEISRKSEYCTGSEVKSLNLTAKSKDRSRIQCATHNFICGLNNNSSLLCFT